MRRKILLADDSITIQKVVNLTFSDEGIDVVTVGNGELAINKLADVRPDIVLADVWMPGRDGYELCEYVKTHPEYKHLPVLLLVGAFEPFDKTRAAAVKADGHLTKPFESRALVATVKKLLEQAAPVIAETFTPPPPLDAARTQIFGSVVNPKPVDSQPRPIVSEVEPPPPTIKISPSQLEDGRNPDLDPLIPVPPVEPTEPPPSAESVLELTIPEQNEPILVYPEPPPTLATPVEPPTFTNPEPPALGVTTSRLAPGELETILQQQAVAKPPTDTSPLEIDDDVIESTHHPVTPEPAAVRDPLLDTFADVAESTSSLRASFDPAVETTAHTGTEAAFVSNVAGEESAASTAAPIPAPGFAEPIPAPEFFTTPPETAREEEVTRTPFVEPELKETPAPVETPEEASVATNRTTLEVASPMVESTLHSTPEPVLETGPIEVPATTADSSAEPPAPPVFEIPFEEDERVRGTDLLPSELVASMRAREAAKETEPEAVAEPVAEAPPPPSFTFELPPDNEPVVEAVVIPPPAEAAPIAETAPEPVAEATPEPEIVTVTPESPAEAPAEAAETPSAAVIVPAVVAGVVAAAAPMVAEAVVAKTTPDEETVEPEGPTTGEIVPAPVTGELVAPEGALDAGQVSQAVIDDIVKRVVAQMSEKVIREIAWEVVPDLAELLIKKHLASTNGAK